MSFADPRGLRIDAPSASALEGFDQALKAWYSFKNEPLQLIEPVLNEWPQFGLAHLLKALLLIGLGERRFANAASRSLAQARKHCSANNTREQALLSVADALLLGRKAQAGMTLDQLLLENPQDILSLYLGHSIDFDRGDHWNLRNRVARVLPCWTPADVGYANVLAMFAFGLEECNQYSEALQTGRQALELEPENPWAVHAVAHVMEMTGQIAQGVEHLRSTEENWAENSPFCYHNWWHLALFHLDRNESAEVMAIYDRYLDTPAADFALGKLDATALLWRLSLFELETGDRWQPLVHWWQQQLERECGHNSFHDFHAAIAFCATGDTESLQQMLERLSGPQPPDEAAPASHLQRELTRPLVQTLLDYCQGNFLQAARALATLRDRAAAFGGSHAQRDIITLTLISAALKGGDKTLAQRYLNERLVAKPTSPLGWRLQERLLA